MQFLPAGEKSSSELRANAGGMGGLGGFGKLFRIEMHENVSRLKRKARKTRFSPERGISFCLIKTCGKVLLKV
jgi:hypothetical protein